MFWKIFLAHVLTDFLFQPECMVRGKSRLPVLALHCGIFFVLSILFLTGELTWALVVALAGLSLVHGLIDRMKCKVQSLKEALGWLWFLLDQTLHLIAISVFIWYFDRYSLLDVARLLNLHNPIDKWPTIVTLSVIIVVGGGYFTATVCNGFLDSNSKKDKPGIEKAGRYIGVLERALVMAAVLANNYVIIGFLLATKSIVRYPEMKEQNHFAEYFLVGTLTSISWAFFGTLLFKQLIS